MKQTHLRWLSTNLDKHRVPLNSEQRAVRQGNIPYWGANSIVDYVDEALLDERVLLIGEDGAPFFDRDRDVAFLSEGPIWPNNHIHILRPNPRLIDDRFLCYFLNQVEYAWYINGSTRDKLTQAQLGSIEIRYPDLPTQKRIAAFLDRETARIDELIAKKRAFADLILAREEASFLAAVTGRKLDRPRVASSVEWIRDLPTGWSAPKFTMVARQETGHTPSRKEPSYWVPEECVIPWLSLADVWQLRTGETIYLEDTSEKISEIGMANSAARLLPKDTVVLSRTASVGFAAIMARPMATTQDFAGWICGPKIRPKFLYYVLRAMKSEFRRLMMGSTHQTIYMPDIRAFRTPLPPLAEQDRIIRELDASIGCYRQVHSRITSSMQKLHELRSTLITAAVSGEIDVETYGKAGSSSATLDRIEEEMQA